MSRREVLASFAVLVLAVALRLYSIQNIPPGLYFDEAANGVDALRVVNGERPIFFEGNAGREPFFIYLMAMLFERLGSSAATIRLTGVLVGIAVVAVTYFLGRVMLGRRVALLAMLAVTVSYWHVSLSRLGLRAGSLALFEGLAVVLLWQGLRSSKYRYWWFAASGSMVGASLYTYLAARVFPVWLGTFLLLMVAFPSLRSGLRPRQSLAAAGILVLSAAVTFAPLGIHFAQHYGEFVFRASGVSVLPSSGAGGGSLQPLIDSTLRTLGMFFVSGDVNPRQNLPGRPVFDPLQGSMFVLGLVLLVRRWREKESVLLLLWLAAAVLPGALSTEAPHYLRTSGLIPGVFIVEAIGLAAFADWLVRFWQGNRWHNQQYVSSVLASCVLLAAGVVTAYDYFVRWAPSAEVYYGFETDLYAATRLNFRGASGRNSAALIGQALRRDDRSPEFLRARSA